MSPIPKPSSVLPPTLSPKPQLPNLSTPPTNAHTSPSPLTLTQKREKSSIVSTDTITHSPPRVLLTSCRDTPNSTPVPLGPSPSASLTWLSAKPSNISRPNPRSNSCARSLLIFVQKCHTSQMQSVPTGSKKTMVVSPTLPSPTLTASCIKPAISSWAIVPLMRCRHGSTRGYAHSEDLETGVRRSGATDRRADRATTSALQPPLRLTPSSRRLRAFSARSDRPETRQERRAQVIRRAHSKLERVVARTALNNTKTTLVVFKSLTVCADISGLYKRLPRVGLVLVRRPCHVGGRPTSRVALQGPGVGAHGTECADRSPGAEVF